MAAIWWVAGGLKGPDQEGFEQADARAQERFERTRGQLNSTLSAPLRESTGALEIHGRVVGPDGPIASATVTATRAERGDVMSDLPCPCSDGCGRSLLELDCEEASRQMMEMVVERRGEAQPLTRATSDAEGRFALDRLAGGLYGLWADAAAGIGVADGVAAGSIDVEIHISRPQTLRGVVVDAGGRPLHGAVITAVPAGHPRFFDTLSAEDGTFAFDPLPSGRYSVVAVMGALLPDHALVQQGDRSLVKLTLHAPKRLRGRVMAGDAPAAGVQVSLEGAYQKEKVVTGENGCFELGRLQPGLYKVSARQGTLQAERQVTVPKLADPPELMLNFERGGTLTGSLRSEAGTPIADGAVHIGSWDGWGETKVAVAADGTFRAEALAPGRFRVRASAKGFQTTGQQPAIVYPGGVTQMQLVMEPAARVEGMVLGPDGAPLVGARVATQGGREQPAAATTDELGRFVLDGLAPGPVVLVATQEAQAAAVEKATAPASGLVLQLGTGMTVEGRVATSSGAPVEGALVLAFSGRLTQRQILLGGETLVQRKGQTDPTGVFHLRGLPSGPVTLAAAPSEHLWRELRGPLSSQVVEVPTQGPVMLELTPGGTISGTVTDASGLPLAGVFVFARVPEGDIELDAAAAFRRASATTNGLGAFELTDLPPGEYGVAAVADGYREVVAQARAGDRGVTLTLKRAPMIRGRVLTASGEPLVAFQVNWSRVEDPGGKFAIPRLESSENTVSINAGSDLAPIWRRVPAGTTDVSLGDLVLGNGRTVTGRVVDAQTGEGIAGATVYAADEHDPMGRYGMTGENMTLTERGGSFALPHVDDGAPTLFAWHDEYGRTSIPLGGATNPEVRLWHETRIVVEVQKQSKERVSVTAYAESGLSLPGIQDSRGRYVVSGLGAGRYTVRVAGEGQAVFLPVSVVVPEHGEAHVVLVERTAGATLRVSVQKDDTGRSLAMVLVAGAVKSPSTMTELNRLLQAGLRPARVGDLREFKLVPAGAFTVVAAAFDEDISKIQVVTVPVTVTGERDQAVDLVIPDTAPVIDQEGGP
ncbi:MAG TPA: carboxypeptidase-like regulatory domain-containing protein [Myxococcaceae bacterium]|nr:carboxypeptidase-like regulatory domain-containing protein [Myxococcaceae bacterium]